MVKKIAVALNIGMPFLQQCPKWIQVLVTVGFVYVILVIVIISIWFLFFRSPQKQKPNVFDSHGRTQLNSRIKKRVDDLYNEIYNEKLKPWIFINTGKPLRVEKHDGTLIQYEGVRFEGTPSLVFWGDNFIPPIIENAIVKAFDQTIEECRKNNIDPKPYVYETNSILGGLIGNVYNRMADIDRKLRGKGNPKNVQRKNVSHEISKMDECLKGHYDAAVLLASENMNTTTPEPEKEKGGLGRILLWLAAIATILLLLFGDNICDRLNEKLKNNKPAAEQSEIPKTENKITTETKTSGDSSPAIITSGPNSPVTVNYDLGGNMEGASDIKAKLTNIENKITKLAEQLQPQLAKQYPTAHTVFGVYQDRPVPMGQMPENLEIDWDTGRIQSTDDNKLNITYPNMTLNGKMFISGNVTQVEKRIGAKSGSVIKIGSFDPRLEVIGIDDELVIVALGFPADDSKK